MNHLGVFLRVTLGLFVALIALFAFSLAPLAMSYEKFVLFGGGGLIILFALITGSAFGWVAYKLIVGAFHGEQHPAKS